MQRIQAALAAADLVRARLRAHFQHENPRWNADRVEAAVAERMLRGNG